MKTKHTPGPWEAFDAKEQDGTPTISVRGQGASIATMDTVSIDGQPFALEPHQVANAQLIAAVPELLEVCQAIAKLNEGQGRLSMAQIAGWAKEIIAKATIV